MKCKKRYTGTRAEVKTYSAFRLLIMRMAVE